MELFVRLWAEKYLKVAFDFPYSIAVIEHVVVAVELLLADRPPCEGVG